jgi:hypothetical protein
MSKGNQTGVTREDQFITCNNCQISKHRDEFHKREAASSGVASWCKICRNEHHKQPEIRQQRKNSSRSWIQRPENGHKKSTYHATFYSNPENLAAKIKSQNERNKVRKQEDPGFLLACTMRTRLNAAIRSNCKGGSAVKDLGCSIEFFRTFIESQFKEGMAWGNYGNRKGQWNLDHKAPLSWFDLSDPIHVGLACNYRNMRPMWASDNVAKGNKIDWSLAGYLK